MSDPKVVVSGNVVLDVNNDRMIRIRQQNIGGPITVRTLTAPNGPFDHRDVENEYEISAGDMVMLLNWYRYQKSHGNENLIF